MNERFSIPVPLRISIRKLWKTSNLCPTQWEGFTEDDRPLYARCRTNDISIAIGCSGDSIDTMLGNDKLLYVLKAHTFRKKFDLDIDDLFDIFDILGINYDNIEKPSESDIKENKVKFDACCNLVGVKRVHNGEFKYDCDRSSQQECWNKQDWCPIRK